jgi:flagellar motility protein MotE (MotC chaperone)
MIAPSRVSPRVELPRSKGGGGWLLPLAMAGLAALVPGRVGSLLAHWDAVVTMRTNAERVALAGDMPVQDAPIVTLRDGVQAHPVVSVTLSGDARPTPVGDDRPEDGRLLAEVARRQAELDRRAHELETRAAQVAAAEKLAREQIAELTRMRQQIEQLVTAQSAAADADIDALVGLYQNMKPVQAAAVLGKLEPPKAATILQRLDNRTAGPILAAMDPNAALAITEEIVQRRAAFRH